MRHMILTRESITKKTSKIVMLNNGINFLGFRVFFHHTLIRKKNSWKFERKLRRLKKMYAKGKIEREKVIESLEGIRKKLRMIICTKLKVLDKGIDNSRQMKLE